MIYNDVHVNWEQHLHRIVILKSCNMLKPERNCRDGAYDRIEICSSNDFSDLPSYPLVNIQKAIENGPVEFVDLPINSMVDLSSSLRKRLPGRVNPMPQSIHCLWHWDALEVAMSVSVCLW